MKPGLYQLYTRLADGCRHSAAGLAGELGLSRAAVHQRVEALRRLGLEIAGSAGTGYRLEHPIEVLDSTAIGQRLSHQEVRIEVAGAVDSTNARLIASGSRHGHALIAETQTAGRGRRGRSWRSPPGSGLYLSLAWRFDSGLADLAPLSLVAGLAVAETLQQLSTAAVKVKWPNDLLIADAKMGGCLVELGGAAEGPGRAVIGVGINLLASAALSRIDQAWTALAEHAQPAPRNLLAAELINALAAALKHLERSGFDDFLDRWPQFDALDDRPVNIFAGNQSITSGIARGLDRHGQLKLETGGRIRLISSGEVSVRAA